ncbi:uncharacterized protein DNG_08732 [Cephalotrichum gorgonifer]|uniref:Uncharacterized protein n=1 Tax=Cephalotrichum gorgonifer TaxID=2041049 RepID=A0AAE8SYT6_9PEZI|nr:uncharacterized protein DNG_08732 [Cephalotrichum gorgonifer]
MTFRTASVASVEITSPFWSHIQTCSRTKTIPNIIDAQKSWKHWECLTWKEGHDVKIHQFWDSDIYKTIEAACYFLVKHPGGPMMAAVEEAVNMIRGAQYEDGYLNSYYTVKGIDKRWTNLRDDHELYCFGHLLEAVVAYETLTGNGRLLEVAMKVCKHLDSVFGTEPGKKQGYPGHQEIEIGLLRLFELTKNPLPLKLAKYFILQRGQRDDKDEVYFDKEAFARGADPYDMMGTEGKQWYHGDRDYGYQQADGPLVDATEVKGHSVRAMYYYTAATDLVRLCADSDSEVAQLRPALDRLWRNMVDKKMYVTGGLGSVTQWEGFGPAYVLPDLESEGCYAETCAAFALINWCSRMLRIDLRAEYADVMETALYNGFLGAVSQDGDAFYYQNVLRTRTGEPKERSKWFGVACCPPNVAKVLGNLGSLIYFHDSERGLVAIHQYIGSELKVPGTDVVITQKTSMPWDGRVTISVSGSVDLALRIPAWAEGWTSSVEGKVENGYLYVTNPGEAEVHLDLPIKATKLYAHPNTGKDEICIRRGPLVYCMEDVDNDGVDIDFTQLIDGPVRDGTNITISGLDQVVPVIAQGRQLTAEKSDGLYRAQAWTYEKGARDITAIPYFLRANRGGNGARVRIHRELRSNNPQLSPALAVNLQSPEAFHSTPSVPVAPGIVADTLLDRDLCNELIELYFDLIHDRQHIIFHRPSFTAEQHAGAVTDYLLLGILALAARFSTNPLFDGTSPWVRGLPFLHEAIRAFHARSKLVDIESLQGTILLGFAAAVEGDSDQEALFNCQTIRMVQLLNLPHNLSTDSLRRQLEIRLYWQSWMYNTWDSVRSQLPTQLRRDPAFPRPIEEEFFDNMKEGQVTGGPDEVAASAIPSIWTAIIPLTQYHANVVQLNHDLVHDPSMEFRARQSVQELSMKLEHWRSRLPEILQDTPTNRARYEERGYAQVFAVMHIIYHHTCQSLYYQFLNRWSPDGIETPVDEEAITYASRCKAHAVALSRAMWTLHSDPKKQCLWSPINGHLLVIASTIHLHTLLLDTRETEVDCARALLEQNFVVLHHIQKYFPYAESSFSRLRAFHKACERSSAARTFDMDRWMVKFLNRYDLAIEDRDLDPQLDEDGTRGVETTALDLSDTTI